MIEALITGVALLVAPFVPFILGFLLLIGGTGMGSDYIPPRHVQEARRERKAARRAFIRRALGSRSQ